MRTAETLSLVALVGVTAVAWVAFSYPILIFYGFLFLVLPGLILMIAPFVALYGWLFAVPYAVLRVVGFAWWRAAIAALRVPAAFGFGRPAQSNGETRANLAAATANDIRPVQPLPIGGTVALIRDDWTNARHNDSNDCDDLCLRLLYNSNAKTVYIAPRGRPGMAFTIERRTVCPPFILSQYVFKWRGWPDRASRKKGMDRGPPPPGLKEVVEARIASGDCLVGVDGPIRPDWTIERIVLPRDDLDDPWSMASSKAHGQRITVYRREGSGMRPVGRFTHASAAPLIVPLAPSPLGSPAHPRWTWGRTTIGDGSWDWDSVSALRGLVAFDAKLPESASPMRLRELLAAAITDPRRERDDAGLLLANSVMVDIVRNGAKTGDAALLARAIGDDRFTKIEPEYELAEKLGADYAIIVDSAIARLGRLQAKDASTFPYGPLSSIITRMPQTWFASPPSSLTSLLRKPVIAARASEIIDKLDAGGAAAVPLLTEIVTQGAEEVSNIDNEGHPRIDMWDSIRAAVSALCRIGPPAGSALGSIIAAKQKLLATVHRRSYRNPGEHSALWRGQAVDDGFVVTLVSFGVPIDQFREPDHPSTVNGSWRGKIRLGVIDHNCTL